MIIFIRDVLDIEFDSELNVVWYVIRNIHQTQATEYIKVSCSNHPLLYCPLSMDYNPPAKSLSKKIIIVLDGENGYTEDLYVWLEKILSN